MASHTAQTCHESAVRSRLASRRTPRGAGPLGLRHHENSDSASENTRQVITENDTCRFVSMFRVLTKEPTVEKKH